MRRILNQSVKEHHTHDQKGLLYPFHLAFPVIDLTETRRFYGELLGCLEGRSSEDWVDFSLYGHQIVAHRVQAMREGISSSEVDGHQVPVRHFGIVLPIDEWQSLAQKLKEHSAEFLIEPGLRFEGTPGAQYTFFIKDPSGNALEFKSMLKPENLFARFEAGDDEEL